MIQDDTPIFKVSQVAKHLNMSGDRLRTYDEEKLVLPFRENNIRLYSNNDIAWLENLRQLISKDKLTIVGFKEILKVSYILSDNELKKLAQTNDENSIWRIVLSMRNNSNYKKLKQFYYN